MRTDSSVAGKQGASFLVTGIRILRLSSRETTFYLQNIAASDKVRLIVSVDSDTRVAKDKGFNPSNGNSPKPLVSWKNRTLLLAKQQITHKNCASRPLIDFITMHGADSCICKSCPHDDNAYMAIALQPDLVVVSSGSPETIRKLNTESIPVNKIKIINENELSYHDKLLNGPIKSSAIIKRAKLKL